MGIGFKCDDDVAAVVIRASSEPLSLAYRRRLTAWGGSLFAIPTVSVSPIESIIQTYLHDLIVLGLDVKVVLGDWSIRLIID